MAAKKSQQYYTVMAFIKEGHIKSIQGILEYVPPTTVANDLGLHHKTLDRRIENPGDFEFRDIMSLADRIGIDFKILAKMVIKASK